MIDIVYESLPATGRVDEVILPTGTVDFSYVAETGQLESIAGPYGGTLAYAWDGPLLLSETSSGPVPGVVSYVYDDNFWVRQVRVNDEAVAYDYDDDGLMTSAGDASIVREVDTGRISSIALGQVSESWGYDDFGDPDSFETHHPAFAGYVDPVPDPYAGVGGGDPDPGPDPEPGPGLDPVPPASVTAPADLTPDTYVCQGGGTVTAADVCDGENDCADGSDEAPCGVVECPMGEPPVDTVLQPEQFCDGVEDCTTGQDEAVCTAVTCSDGSGVFPGFMRCDGPSQCADGSDEVGCPYLCGGTFQFVEPGQVCDGNDDCPDGDDEFEQACVGSGKFLCEPGSNESLTLDRVCDGVTDCGNGADEASCEVYCADGLQTVPETAQCDGVAQCGDGSDELNCPFSCGGGEFVNTSVVCDGSPNCSNGQDEVGCDFVCEGGGTVPDTQVCDGNEDCSDGSDEAECGTPHADCRVDDTCVFLETLERDDLGRISAKVETVFGTTHRYDYDYDLRGRLTEVKVDGEVVEAYDYDANGNRTYTKNLDEEFYASHDPQDRLLTAGDWSFVYNEAGDLVWNRPRFLGAATPRAAR